MFVFLKIIQEGLLSALRELWANKLRTFLSILGITIGVFCVISVFMMVDSMERSVKSGFQRLGDDVVFINRFPWDHSASAEWWKFIKRPRPGYKDFLAVKEKVESAQYVTTRIFIPGKGLKSNNNSVDNVPMVAASHDFAYVFNMEFEQGRYFTEQESALGKNVILIGHTLAESLFPYQDPIGKVVKTMGRKLTVVGVMKKEGKSLLGDGLDGVAIIPYHFARTFIDLKSGRADPVIAVRAKPGVALNQLKDDITMTLRGRHRLKPLEDDDFSLNQLSLLTAMVDAVFSLINLAGGLIGLFSILVGGFGIANIMFVSVKERTGIIGIKKSLGAKNYFILLEFLIEAICLCLLGGLFGLLLVALLAYFGNMVIDNFTIALSMNNVIWAIVLSMVIGIFSGIVPAIMAAKMNPVDAIRAN